MLSIDKLYAYIAVDDEGEGITSFITEMGPTPMIGADQARVDSLKPMAQMIANQSNCRVVLTEFSVRTDLEIIEPDGGPLDPNVRII